MRDSAALSVYEGNDAEESIVSPTRDTRSTDVTALHVPVPYLVTVIALAIGIAGGIWKIDARISVMEARDDSRREVDAANKRADAVLYDHMKQSVDELKRQTQLLQLQYAELSKQITRK